LPRGGARGQDGGPRAFAKDAPVPADLPLQPLDLLAVAWFAAVWAAYVYLVEVSPWRARSLSRAMDDYRRVWIRTMSEREQRIVDASILAGLQNGTAFFASTAVLAIGAAFALLNAADEMLMVFAHLSPSGPISRREWEIKGLGLLTIYAYAFFKFGWSYRLFNYASILVGAVPPPAACETAEGRAAVERASEMLVIAGRHFNRGLRAFFFSIGFLGWFAGPVSFMAATTLIAVVLARRQFASASFRAVRGGSPGRG
jgi:uncharacterized membrane protein